MLNQRQGNFSDHILLLSEWNWQCRIEGGVRVLLHPDPQFVGGGAIGGSGKLLTVQTDSNYGSG